MSLHSLKLNEVKDTVFLATMLERRVVANPSHMWWSNSLQNVPLCAAMGLGADNCQQLISLM